MKIVLFLAVLFTTLLEAKEAHFDFDNFDKASKSSNYIRFDMESTKAGIVTTSFNGFVKKYKINYDIKEKTLSNISVSFKGNHLDTDNESRNKKMYNKCLDTTNYPEIIVKLSESVKLEENKKYKGIIIIRGKSKPIEIDLQTKLVGNQFKVSGSSVVKISELEIPDPSIWIASVRDEIELKFNFLINK